MESSWHSDAAPEVTPAGGGGEDHRKQKWTRRKAKSRTVTAAKKRGREEGQLSSFYCNSSLLQCADLVQLRTPHKNASGNFIQIALYITVVGTWDRIGTSGASVFLYA